MFDDDEICGPMFPKNHVRELSQPYGEAGFREPELSQSG